MALDPLHEKEQLRAIEIELATARDYIQDDLKSKFGYGENIFFDLDLIEYRMNNSGLDIAEDLDLEERYDLINDQAKISVGFAFRGYNGKDFPDHKFDGLLGKITNDYIQGIRHKQTGLKWGQIGGLIGGRATVETHGDQLGNGGRIADSRGTGKFQKRELLEDIVNFREESIGKGYFKTKPSWDYITDELNGKYGEDWTTRQVKQAYRYNKERIIKLNLI